MSKHVMTTTLILYVIVVNQYRLCCTSDIVLCDNSYNIQLLVLPVFIFLYFLSQNHVNSMIFL